MKQSLTEVKINKVTVAQVIRLSTVKLLCTRARKKSEIQLALCDWIGMLLVCSFTQWASEQEMLLV